MNCDACKSILDLFSEKRLTSKWTTRVAAHLERCPSCAALEKGLRPAPASKISASASFKERLRRATVVGNAAPETTAAAARIPMALWALAIVVFVLLALNAAIPGPLSQPAWRLQ